ncbi:MAG: hypothetical protein PHW18_05160 [Sulfuricurvum sp.]|jgi:hypothetical protein|uniref:hypothetical protein n=1 Tax=Sulfuricurvum sp. TaxID=2025608 RepID=UPI002611D98E|nr:hypothetical protein [Sulfuricurvum sp.]MDD2828944.1 hypothetical protein [Sulfuricurvum sp.]MDD4950043.1 hypothetical protein [Sulfuricurvum sp.]
MSKYPLREAILAKFEEPSNIDYFTLRKKLPATKKGKTLADFYAEVFQSSQPIYEQKSAKEIEVMMMQNRRLIESKNKRR